MTTLTENQWGLIVAAFTAVGAFVGIQFTSRRLKVKQGLISAPSNGQCQYAMSSTELPRCTKDATRKLGDHWFCEEHGNRKYKGD